jgi:2-polyprenyl-3-methyl-5-hydroxy-6-metoxy-1,4-benzoquinol methylase
MPNVWQRQRGETVRRWVLKLGLTRPRILDFGCGTGWFSDKLTDVGDVTAIDLSEAAIAIARSSYPSVHFIAGNMFEVSLPAEQFDIVVSQEVIAHVERQSEYLDRCAAALRGGGYLVITTANKFVMDRLGWPQPLGHIEQYLTMRRFKRLLRRRFSVLDVTSIIPIGDQGLLRLVNSYKLNAVAARLLSPDVIGRLKGRARLGYTLIALARRAS